MGYEIEKKCNLYIVHYSTVKMFYSTKKMVLLFWYQTTMLVNLHVILKVQIIVYDVSILNKCYLIQSNVRCFSVSNRMVKQ